MKKQKTITYPKVGEFTTHNEEIVKVIIPKKVEYKGKIVNAILLIVKTRDGTLKPLISVLQRKSWNLYGISKIQDTGETEHFDYLMKDVKRGEAKQLYRIWNAQVTKLEV